MNGYDSMSQVHKRLVCKRLFVYEKDIAIIGTANNKQRRELLSKSKGFSDWVASDSFL
jgi:hypothetical protein